MPLAWGLPGTVLTTWGTGNDHGWPHMANPVFPVTAPVYFYVLYSATRKDPKFISPSPWRFLSMLVKKQYLGHIPGKTRSAVYVSDRVPPKKKHLQDWERVVGLGECMGCPCSYTYRMF